MQWRYSIAYKTLSSYLWLALCISPVTFGSHLEELIAIEIAKEAKFTYKVNRH